MKAGWLRHRITLQTKSTTQDTYGAEQDVWTDEATVWASVEPLRGQEYFSSKQMQAEETTRIRIRYRSGITPAWRVIFGDRIFNIKSIINPQERNIFLELMCEEAVT